MDDLAYLFSVFAAMMLVSFAERAVPFVASDWLKKQKWVDDLGKFLPLAIMVLLVVHAAAGAAAARGPFELFGSLPVAEFFSIALTLALQWFFKSALVSIFAGTAFYVAMVNGFIPGLA